MKSVLLYANQDQGFEARLQAALDAARAFGAHISCLQATPFDGFIMGDPFGGIYALPSVVEQVREAEDTHRTRTEARLAAEGVSWDWSRYDGAPSSVIVDRARLADLVVLNSGPAEGREAGPLPLAAEVAVHLSAPLLAVPKEARGWAPAQRLLVAWNGSPESAHAIRLTLPLLRRAEAVHIVTVSDDRTDFPATDACAYLSRHGIGAELHEWRRDGRPVAETLIDAAVVLGAGTVVMGAYGHSRLREAVLGGVTRDMLRGSPLPLVLAH